MADANLPAFFIYSEQTVIEGEWKQPESSFFLYYRFYYLLPLTQIIIFDTVEAEASFLSS